MPVDQDVTVTDPGPARFGYPANRPRDMHQLMIELPDRVSEPPPVHGLTDGGGDGWRWRDEEIFRLESLLVQEGFASQPATAAETSGVDRLLANGRVSAEVLTDLLTAIVSTPDVVEAVLEIDVAGRLSSLIEQAHRHRGLARLADVVDNPVSTRDDLTLVLEREPWVFGGRYIPPYAIQRLPELDGVSLLLVRTDGAIHVVEAGPANVPDVILRIAEGPGEEAAGRYGVGKEVQVAVNRAIDKLRLLDQHQDRLQDVLEVETRRAMATVLIGHRGYVSEEFRSVLRTTLRTYSSHLAGIEVITYDDLIYNAERMLAMDDPPPTLEALR
jgi:hypothetical protein